MLYFILKPLFECYIFECIPYTQIYSTWHLVFGGFQPHSFWSGAEIPPFWTGFQPHSRKRGGLAPFRMISRRNYPSWSGAEIHDKDRDTLIEQSL